MAIRARAAGDRLEIIVEDDGVPADKAPDGTTLGLRNVCERLTKRFGDRARCAAGPRAGCGYRVTLNLPMTVAAAPAKSQMVQHV